MKLNNVRKVALILPAVPLVFGLISTVMFAIQGGFGGGHGSFDFHIGVLGLPSILLVEGMPLPDLALNHDIILVVWLPAILNAALFSLVSCGILHIYKRIKKGQEA